MLIWTSNQPVTMYWKRVADFCPRCRHVQSLLILEYSVASSLYTFNTGAGPTLAFDAMCEVCDTRYPTTIERYTAVTPAVSEPVASLVEQTNPALLGVRGEEPKRPEAIRRALLRGLCGAELARLASPEGTAGCITLIGVLVFIALPIVVFRLDAGPGEVWSSSDYVGSALCLAFALAVPIALFNLGRKRVSRYVRRRSLPMIGRELAPLRPSDAELAAALVDVVGHRPSAVELNVASLRAAVDRAAATPRTGAAS